MKKPTRDQARRFGLVAAAFVAGAGGGIAGVVADLYLVLLLLVIAAVAFVAGVALGLWQSAEVHPWPPRADWGNRHWG